MYWCRFLQQCTLPSSMRKVPFGLIGCVLAAHVNGQKLGGKIQTCLNFLHDHVRYITQCWPKRCFWIHITYRIRRMIKFPDHPSELSQSVSPGKVLDQFRVENCRKNQEGGVERKREEREWSQAV